MQMMTSAIYGLPICPAALADEKGNAVVVQSLPSVQSTPASAPIRLRMQSPFAWLERLLRPVCTEMGCSAGLSCRPLTGQQLRQVSIHAGC